MKIFVTGGNGFLGSHLIDHLLARGDEVHALVRTTSNLRWLQNKPVHLHYGDVLRDWSDSADQKGLEAGIRDAEIVFHVAGVIRARKKKTYSEVNTRGTADLLETCLRVNPQVKRIVVVTSLAAHGPTPGDEPARETDECNPLTDYGKSKRDAELIALRYAEKLPITIIRPPAIYGPRDDQVFHFFRMVKKGVAFLPGKGQRRLNLAYVEDVVRGLIRAAESPKAVGEIFFVGEDRNYDWQQTADLIGEAMGVKKLVKISVPEPLVYGMAVLAEGFTLLTGRLTSLNLAYARNFLQKNWTLDISKAKGKIGFQSLFSLAQGVSMTADWYRQEGWL